LKEWKCDAKDGRKISIRHAKVSDASVLHENFCQVVYEAEWLPTLRPNSNQAEWAEWIQRTYGNREILLIAHIDEDYVGHLSLQPEEWAASRHVARLGIIVRKLYRGLGVGKALMEASEEAGRQQKYEKITLSTFEDNIIARNLYDRMGYRFVGKRERHFQMPKGFIDEILMEKPLV